MIGGPTPARDRVRRAFGIAAGRDALLLGIVARGAIMLVKGDGIGALNEIERRQVRTAVLEINMARKRLKRLSRRIDNEN